MFAKVENGVTKSCHFFAKKTQFWPEIFHFFEQDRLLFVGVEIGVTEFPTKTAKKEKKRFFVSLRFLQKWVRNP